MTLNALLIAAAAVPVPRDLDLPLPLDPWILKILIVALFLAHILFVNLMVGGSLLTVAMEIIGLHRPGYDAIARRLGQTITVNKSMAVVLGVGPLLVMNLLYMTHFYSANALTGYAWIALVPLVTLAFLITYLHKYTWDRWTGPAKRYHIALGAFGSFLFLTVPLIFLANINLMLFPERWAEVQGFFSSLSIGNVFPRYFHFLTASLAITALFAAGWFARKKYPVETNLAGYTRPHIRRFYYRVAFWVTVAQIVFGPLLLLTLPERGFTGELLIVIGTGVVVAGVVLTLLWREIRADDRTIGRNYWLVVGSFLVLVVFMATGRHVYREAAVNPHRLLIADRTSKFQAIELAAQMRLAAGLGIGDALTTGPTGQSVFQTCAACHAVDKVLAAPPVQEIYSIYKDNPDGIVKWAENPGKKRAQFQQMPSMAALGPDKLKLVAEYMLKIGAPQTQKKSEAGEKAGDKAEKKG